MCFCVSLGYFTKCHSRGRCSYWQFLVDTLMDKYLLQYSECFSVSGTLSILIIDFSMFTCIAHIDIYKCKEGKLNN